jgi:hypothetical protein
MMRINTPHPKERASSIQYRKTVSRPEQGVCNVRKTGVMAEYYIRSMIAANDLVLW